MITQRVFNSIKELSNKATQESVNLALMEELGEYIRAVRIEDGLTLNKNKVLDESSKVEIIDLILVAIEAFISRGGTHDELLNIAFNKMYKWSQIVHEHTIS